MICMYAGARGRGKTLTLVKDAYEYHRKGFRVIANFNISFGEYLSNDEILKLNRNSELFDCVLALDEVQIFFDSREFKDKKNISFSNFVQQIRKRNVIILCTAQYVNTVELRLRQHIDVMAYPEFKKDINYCKVMYFDLSSLEDFNAVDPYHATVIYDAAPIFKLYDTKEMLV